MPKDQPPSGFSATVISSVGTAIGSSTASAVAEAIVGHVRNPLPAEHPAYAMIGRVTSEWAHLEHALDIIIWEMAGLRFDIGSSITGQMVGHWPRFNAIIALGMLRSLDQKLLKDIDATARSSSELSKERNRIVHDAWFTEAPGALASQFRSALPKKVAFGFEDVTDTYVTDLIDKIVKKRETILTLRARIKSSLQA